MTEFRENRDVRRPFPTTPDARVYFPAASIEKARRAVARCLRRDEGVALILVTHSPAVAEQFDRVDLLTDVNLVAKRKLAEQHEEANR